MNFEFDDGGRALAGYKGTAGDCSVRALCIAAKIDYKEAYDKLAAANKLAGNPKSVRNGIMKDVYDKVLSEYGFTWHSAPKFIGRKAKASDLTGIVIARQSKHFVCVIDGIPQDIFDSSDKMVYGYWSK